MAVPVIYAEIVSGSPNLLHVRGFATDTELVQRLSSVADKTIETAYWLRAQRETRTHNIALSLHCRCGGVPFDLGFHFESGDRDGRRQVEELKSAASAAELKVELLADTEGDAPSPRLDLNCQDLKDTDLIVRTIAPVF